MLSYIVTASINELKNLKRLMHASLRTNRKGGEAKEAVPWGQEQGVYSVEEFRAGKPLVEDVCVLCRDVHMCISICVSS